MSALSFFARFLILLLNLLQSKYIVDIFELNKTSNERRFNFNVITFFTISSTVNMVISVYKSNHSLGLVLMRYYFMSSNLNFNNSFDWKFSKSCKFFDKCSIVLILFGTIREIDREQSVFIRIMLALPHTIWKLER